MRPKYVAAVKADAAVAEEILKLRVLERRGYRFYPDTYEFAPAITDEGIEFYDVNEAQYDLGWEVDKETVSWDDIANAAVLIPELKRNIESKKRAEARDEKRRKREQFERLRAELGEK